MRKFSQHIISIRMSKEICLLSLFTFNRCIAIVDVIVSSQVAESLSSDAKMKFPYISKLPRLELQKMTNRTSVSYQPVLEISQVLVT